MAWYASPLDKRLLQPNSYSISSMLHRNIVLISPVHIIEGMKIFKTTNYINRYVEFMQWMQSIDIQVVGILRATDTPNRSNDISVSRYALPSRVRLSASRGARLVLHSWLAYARLNRRVYNVGNSGPSLPPEIASVRYPAIAMLHSMTHERRIISGASSASQNLGPQMPRIHPCVSW